MKTAALATVAGLVCAGCAEAEEFGVHDPLHYDAAGPGVTAGTGVAGASSAMSSSSAGPTSTGSTATTSGAGGASGGAQTTGNAGTGNGGSAGRGTGGAGGGPTTGGSGGSPQADASPDAGRGGSAIDAAVDRAPPPPTNGFQVLYKCVGTNAMASAIQAETTIDDVGPATVPLNELTLRYYFSNELTGTPLIDIGFSGLNPGFHDLKSSETTQVVKVQNPTFTADNYLEFGFGSGTGLIAPGQSVIIAWQLHGPGFPNLNQSNDYSFDPTKTSAVAWERVVLMRAGFVIWGTPP
jgi:hypothetical protein